MRKSFLNYWLTKFNLTISIKKNGSVQMVFICKGWKELIYVFMHPDWLGHIKIKEPKELKDAVKDYLKVCKDMI